MRLSSRVLTACALGATSLACASNDATTGAPTIVVTAPTMSAPPPPIVSPSTVAPKPPAKEPRAPQGPVQRDPVRAEALFTEARQAMARGDFAAACELFAESHAYDPADGTLANLASCEEKIGELHRARDHWQQVFDGSTAAGRSDRAALARQRIDAIDRQLSGTP